MELTTDMKESLNRKYQSIKGSLNGSSVASIEDLKSTSLEKLGESGLPARKDEEYRYTPLSKVFTPDLIESLQVETSDYSTDFPDIFENRSVLVVSNGIPDFERSSILDSRISVTPIEDGAENDITSKTGFLTEKTSDAFVQLNTSLWSRGFAIDVPENHSVTEPLVIHYISSAEDTVFTQPRGLINLNKNSELNVVEFYSNKSASSISNQVVEIYVAESARLNYFKIQDEGEEDTRLDHTFIEQRKHSLVNVYTMTFSGKVVRNNLFINLEDEHCESHMYGLYLTKGKTHVDNHTTVDHLKPNCFSNELYKGVMDDQSTGVFNGKIYVREDAQKTNAFQSNKNILLSDDATVNTKPQLEIWADDVKCSHGCTNGQLDEEQLFYIRSRGIGEKEARKILLHAFAADVLTTISNESLRSYLDDKIIDSLG